MSFFCRRRDRNFVRLRRVHSGGGIIRIRKRNAEKSFSLPNWDLKIKFKWNIRIFRRIKLQNYFQHATWWIWFMKYLVTRTVLMFSLGHIKQYSKVRWNISCKYPAGIGGRQENLSCKCPSRDIFLVNIRAGVGGRQEHVSCKYLCRGRKQTGTLSCKYLSRDMRQTGTFLF